MTVLDASVIIAGLTDPSTTIFEDLFRGPDVGRVSTINVAEVVDVLIRTHGIDQADVIDAIDILIEGGMTIDGLSARQALAAGAIRARHFDRRTRAVSMADCVVVALAAEVGEPIASTDGALLEMAAAEGVATMDPSRWVRPS